MFAKTTVLLAAFQASLALAGNTILSNRCSYDIWAWSVDQSGSSQAIHVPARSKYTEPMRSGTAVSMKISKTNQLLGDAQTQFEYVVNNGQVWYDISFVNCAKGESADSCPGHDKGLTMAGSLDSCGQAKCAGGSYCPKMSYYVDFPLQKLGLQDPVFTCPGSGTNMDMVMTVCSDESSLKRSIAGRLMVEDE